MALGEALLELQQLTERLRRDCPWDREQTARTIVPHTVEEAYEVAGAALLLGLHLLPTLANAAGGVSLDLAEHVRMPPDELGVHDPRHLLEVALTLLLEEQRQEVDLEEQVAELVEQLRRISRIGGVRDLVGLLDGVRHDRARRLLAVPGAVATQPPRQLL